MRPLEELAQEAKTMPPGQFLSKYYRPMLVHRLGQVVDGTVEESKTTVFNYLDIKKVLATPVTYLVYPIVKTLSSPMLARVEVGRGKSCDIRLEYDEVSKLHAYFTWSANEKIYHLTDAAATNGTFVDGRRLASNESVQLASGSRLMFGRHTCTFYVPTEFLTYLRQF